VIKWKWLITAAAGCLVFYVWPADACQYNVREVGFVDVGIEPYRLLVYLPEGVSAGEMSSLKEAMDVALVETNVRFTPVGAGADANQATAELARTHGISRFPAAILVSPDGQSMPVALPEKPAAPAQAIPAALGGVLDSPLRRQILEKCAETYGVVLLIEGPEPQANATAREAITTAIRQIGEQLEFLPTPIKSKPITTPPQLVVLDRTSLAREQVLLWTFRLKPEDVNQPRAAVFYGRGRWLGPLFDTETLNAGNLMQLLSVIGGDCECGLDQRWLQGTMLPARWDETLHQKVVQNLGYDPESPMAKMEMVSIIRRGMGGFDYPGVPFEYQEIEVGMEETEDSGQKSGDRDLKPEAQAAPEPAPPAPQAPSQTTPPSSKVVGQVLAGSLAGMAALVGVVSLVIVLRARKP
jgi:hypothetical protein